MALTETASRVSYQEFINLDIPDDDDHIYELLDGEIVKYSAPESRHQIVLANLFRQVDNHVFSKKLGRVLFAPLSVMLGEHSAPQPDLLFVATKHLKIIEEKCVMGAPNLVVEIISPGSVVRDRVQKKEIYEKAGIPEYWIVDPKYALVEVYQHTSSGYTLFHTAEGEGTVKSKVIKGLEINVADIFAE
ncbi:MAG: Uma2 family endonuclease [Tunicatimonas sp.]